MIDWQKEKVIPLQEVRKFVISQTPGKQVSPSTIWRWATKRNNPLETFTMGGGRFTSVEAIGRFIQRCNVDTIVPVGADVAVSRGHAAARPSANAVRAGERLRNLIDGQGQRQDS